MGPEQAMIFSHLEDAQGELARLKAIEDELKQNLYESRKAKNINDILILELQDDIENLQKELKKKQEQADVKNRWKNITKEIQILMNEVTSLQTQLDEEVELKKQLVKDFKEKVALLKIKQEKTLNIIELNNNVEKAKMENDKLKVELATNEENMTLLVEKKEDLKNFKGQLQVKTNEINEIKSNYEVCKHELSSIVQSLQELRSSNSTLSSELTNLKAGPIGDIHRGNSLFAEVEDYTSVIKQKRMLLENKYNKLKKLIQQKNSRITDLTIKNSNLQLKSCLGQLSVEDSISKYSDEISKFEESITELENRPYTPDLIFEGKEENLKWMQTFIDIESRKALLSDKQFRTISTELYNLSCMVFHLQAESKTLNQDISSLAAYLKELHVQLLDKEKKIKLTKPVQTEKCNKTVRFAEVL